MDYKFQRTRIDKISRDNIIEQLEKSSKSDISQEMSVEEFEQIWDGTVYLIED